MALKSLILGMRHHIVQPFCTPVTCAGPAELTLGAGMHQGIMLRPPLTSS